MSLGTGGGVAAVVVLRFWANRGIYSGSVDHQVEVESTTAHTVSPSFQKVHRFVTLLEHAGPGLRQAVCSLAWLDLEAAETRRAKEIALFNWPGNHPSIFHLWVSQVWRELIPAVLAARRGPTLDTLPGHCRAMQNDLFSHLRPRQSFQAASCDCDWGLVIGACTFLQGGDGACVFLLLPIGLCVCGRLHFPLLRATNYFCLLSHQCLYFLWWFQCFFCYPS